MLKYYKKITSFLICFIFIQINLLSYPPAPHHTFEGMLRDEFGRPIVNENVKIEFLNNNDIKIESKVSKIITAGINYRIEVPMDSGSVDKLYKPFATTQNMPFKIIVRIGNKTFLPIEMIGSSNNIGMPSGVTILDLTLGEDSDRDGLPDAWERALLINGQTINDISPHSDTDGDGLSNYEEYISGNYAFDKKDGLRLEILNKNSNENILNFLAISGRTYTLYESQNLHEWKQIQFKTNKNPDDTQSEYIANKVENVELIISKPIKLKKTKSFYKLMVR